MMTKPDYIPANFTLDRDWAQASLQSWDHVLTDELRHLVKSEEWQDSANINITSVVGTMHPDYAGSSWVDLLKSGKRMAENLALFEQNPDYYTDPGRKTPTMDYVSVNGKDWFIGGDGLHRTCIARFGFAGDDTPFILKGVSTNLYTIDTELAQAVSDLRQMLEARNIDAAVRPTRTHIGREDGSGWKRDIYQISVAIQTRHFNYLTLSRDAVFAAYQMIQSEPRFARYMPFYSWWLMGRLHRLGQQHQQQRGTEQ